MQPDTRNPFLITAMEALGHTENRYSRIPKIRQAMAEAGLPEPVFCDSRGEFSVCLYNGQTAETSSFETTPPQSGILNDLLYFCKKPRTRKEIADFLQIASQQYAIRRYVEPLVQNGIIQLSKRIIPEAPNRPISTSLKNEELPNVEVGQEQ